MVWYSNVRSIYFFMLVASYIIMHAPSEDWSTETESCNLWSKRSTSKPPQLDRSTYYVLCSRPTIWIPHQYIRKQDAIWYSNRHAVRYSNGIPYLLMSELLSAIWIPIHFKSPLYRTVMYIGDLYSKLWTTLIMFLIGMWFDSLDHSISHHLNSKQVKVCYSDKFAFWMFAIQIPLYSNSFRVT